MDKLISLAGLQTQEGMEQKPDNNPDYKGMLYGNVYLKHRYFN